MCALTSCVLWRHVCFAIMCAVQSCVCRAMVCVQAVGDHQWWTPLRWTPLPEQPSTPLPDMPRYSPFLNLELVLFVCAHLRGRVLIFWHSWMQRGSRVQASVKQACVCAGSNCAVSCWCECALTPLMWHHASYDASHLAVNTA